MTKISCGRILKRKKKDKTSSENRSKKKTEMKLRKKAFKNVIYINSISRKAGYLFWEKRKKFRNLREICCFRATFFVL
jgi:hypothetical protein